MTDQTPEETAFYYPGHIWRAGDWVKSVSLFFDKVALLVPDYMKDRPGQLEPEMVAGMEQAGLLRFLSPEQMIDREAATKLATSLADVITTGVLDDLPSDGEFHALSMSRLGFGGDRELAMMIVEEFQDRGLAQATADGVSIPLHPYVRNLVLVLLAQVLRAAGPGVGAALHPVTDHPRMAGALGKVITSAAAPGHNDVIKTDLAFVAPDLSAVPLDEVLDFRDRYGAEYRSYSHALRTMSRDHADMDETDRRRTLEDRAEALSDLQDHLRRGARKDMAVKSVLGLGVVGSIAGAFVATPIIAAFGAAAGGAGLLSGGASKAPEAYSYLFQIKNEFG